MCRDKSSPVRQRWSTDCSLTPHCPQAPFLCLHRKPQTLESRRLQPPRRLRSLREQPATRAEGVAARDPRMRRTAEGAFVGRKKGRDQPVGATQPSSSVQPPQSAGSTVKDSSRRGGPASHPSAHRPPLIVGAPLLSVLVHAGGSSCSCTLHPLTSAALPLSVRLYLLSP